MQFRIIKLLRFVLYVTLSSRTLVLPTILMMKANIILIVNIVFLTLLCFGIPGINISYQSTWSSCVLFLVFPSLPFLLNFLLIPGGFAWMNHNKSSTTKLPGPLCWPFLGVLPHMGSHAHRKLANVATSLGAKRLMCFSLGSTRVIISSYPETAKEILCGSSFSDRPVKESAKQLMFERAIGFASANNYWRHLRRIAATHMFSPRRISCLEGVRQRTADNMVVLACNEMKIKGFIELRDILRKGSLDSILKSVFGGSLGIDRERKLGLMVNEGYELISEYNWADYFPFGFMDFNGVKRRCNKLANNVKSLVIEIIKERRREGELSLKNDFLSALLALPKDEQICDDDMVAVLWEMVFRGAETVAILLEWIMARIILHQDIQARAQQEIEQCVGQSRPVQDSDIPRLPFLQAIVKEVLRLHPPGPLLSWARLATQDVHVDKYFIPSGTTAMVNMWAISHDPTIWEDPWAFKPERFIGNELSILGSDLRLAPFGAGRRVCPGKALGLASVHLWLARFLQMFEWGPSQHQPVDLSECLKLSLEMKKPLVCEAILRVQNVIVMNIW